MTVEPSEAFALFYKNNRGPVFRALLARSLDRAAAEDATAEAFARAFAHWHTVADHPNPRAWVLRVAWNYHTSTWRSWDGRRVADPPPATPPAAEQWVDPDLIAAIAGLPDGQREVVVLAALGELRPAEIAKVLGKAASTVRGQLARARTLPSLSYRAGGRSPRLTATPSAELASGNAQRGHTGAGRINRIGSSTQREMERWRNRRSS